ncbi:toxin Cry1Ac domain D-VI-related protein, partial [Listeria booriae]|uniref:toxin Cry1Ac domain D-VI-related protein n=1 Tax=Listeria booriae TaxID=1552123 RepID=UPI0016260C2F
MNRKKIVSMLTASTLVGSTVASPITAMAQEQPAQQTVSKANKTTKSVPVNVRSIENPELFKVSSDFKKEALHYSDKKWYNLTYFYEETNEVDFGGNLGIYNNYAFTSFSDLGDTKVFENDNGVTLRLNDQKQEFSVYSSPIATWGGAHIAQPLRTENYKEYTLTADVTVDKVGDDDESIVKIYAISKANETDTISASVKHGSVTRVKLNFRSSYNGTDIFFEIPKVAKIDPSGNKKYVTFSNVSVKKSDAQVEIDTQEVDKDNQTAARNAVNNLFENKDPKGKITNTLTQAEIDAAQGLVDKVLVAGKKAELQNDLDEAQKQLDARNATAAELAAEKARQEAAETSVKELFNNNDVTGSIKGSTNQAAIDNAQQKVDVVTDSTKKAALQKDLDEAQKQLDARNAAAAEKARQEAAETSVKELFNNNDVTGSIKDSTNQAAIDNAQQKVDAVTDSKKKAELQKNLDEAQRQFDVNYEYRLKGLGDNTFATIDISMQKMWADINIKAGAPHVYFADTYASIVIQDKAGNEKYAKTFIGVDTNQASTVRVPLAIGDEITTYHREATSGSTDRLEIQNEKTKAYLEAATTITYVVTSQGLVVKTEVQAQDKAREAVNNLFENKDPKGKITDSLTQAEIGAAQGLVDQVKDTTKKAELQKDLDEAQKQLTAKKEAEENAAEKARQEAAETSVKELFNNNDVTGSIKDSTNQAAIDNAQQKVDAVTDSTKKAELQKNLDEAQRQFDVNYEYRFKGLGDFTFATIDISMQKMWADIDIKAGAPHVYFANNYAAILIQDKAGNIKYTKFFMGTDVNQASTVRVPLAIGDEITTYHREATSGSTDRLEIQNEKTKAYLEAATTITYVVTSQGLVVKTEVQAQDKAREAVNNLFENKDPKGKITDSLTQAEIGAAQGLVDQVKDTTKKAELQKDLDEAQKQLTAKKEAEEKARQAAAEAALKALFYGNDVNGTIKDTTNQAAIDNVQGLIDVVTDPIIKAALQKDLDHAQALLDARIAAELDAADKGQQLIATFLVNQLFQNNDPLTDEIKNITDQLAIDTAQSQIDLVKVSTVREALQQTLDRAQELLDARNREATEKAAEKAVNELFKDNKPATGVIKDTTNQDTIDAAQKLVDKVTDPTIKAALQKDLDKAQELLDAKLAAEKAAKEAEAAAEKAVDELFQDNKPATGVIKDTTNQGAIDAAQQL